MPMKDSQTNRPQSQNRSSMSLTPSHSLPIRHSTSRHHSHSMSLGAINPSHRVTRRKSMTSTAANNAAAIAAAINGTDEKTLGTSLSNRRSLTLKHSGGGRAHESAMAGSTAALTSESGYVQSQNGDQRPERDESAVDDGLLAEGNSGNSSKARARRASEGAYLSKSEGKRASGELRCEKCGKGYKHSSCLTKHLSVCPGSLSSTFYVLGSIIPGLGRLAFVHPGCVSCGSFWVTIGATLLTMSSQVGAYAGMVVHLQAPHFETSAGPATRSSLGPCRHESGSIRSAGFYQNHRQ